MSLRNEIRRGVPVTVDIPPKSTRGLYDTLPLQRMLPTAPQKADANLFTQLHKGHKIPDAKPFIIDHDRAELINAQDHGLKINLSDKTLGQLGHQSNEIVDEIKRAIARATVTQIRGLARDVGVPIVDSITDMKSNIIHSVGSIFKNGIDVQSKQQQDIVNMLQKINDGQLTTEHVDEIKRTIARGTVIQIQRLAERVGTPIVDSITHLKDNINHDIEAAFNNGNQRQQDAITKAVADIVGQIKPTVPTPAVLTPAVPSLPISSQPIPSLPPLPKDSEADVVKFSKSAKKPDLILAHNALLPTQLPPNTKLTRLAIVNMLQDNDITIAAVRQVIAS